jgi:hypothetical protein
MKHIVFLLLLFLASSCQFFETEKISTEIFYDEELKAIDWKEVDQYPIFIDCDSLSEKQAQKTCFEQTLSLHLYKSISSKHIIATQDINDTVQLEFSISKEGILTVKNMEIDSLIQADLPLLKDWILQTIDSLQPIAPAYKRGIPVSTQFTLPIVIKTQEEL